MSQVVRILRPTFVLVVLVAFVGASALWAGQKKKHKKDDPDWLALDDVSQQVQEVPYPPPALTVDTGRLTFQVSPISTKRLLSDQTEVALKDLLQKTKHGRIVKLRAFVAGTGDIRTVQNTVSDILNQKKIPLPVLTLVQVGALPYRDAEVVLEATTLSKDVENPHGLAFISGQPAVADELTFQVAPLAELSVRKVEAALGAAGLDAKDALRVTCFVSSVDDASKVVGLLQREFPGAAQNVVQIQRASPVSLAECEAVARLKTDPPETVVRLNPQELGNAPSYSQVVLVNTPQLVLTGGQLAFRFQEEDARLAFERLNHTLEAEKTTTHNIVMANIYPLSSTIADLVRKVRPEFLDRDRPPAVTMLTFQGLPSIDASFSLDVVAVPGR
jgi:enamine deaminase RidA (YjgF/YER057c/UK114 family)